jgi:ribosomal protein S18 acetylase RimI-like enzyme
MTGDELTVRSMADGEEAAVIALWHACGLTRPWNDPAADLAFARGKVNSDVLVGLVGERIVASAMVGHDGHRGTMYYVSVDPACRGRGLGAALGFYEGQGYVAGTSVQIEKWIDASKKTGGT